MSIASKSETFSFSGCAVRGVWAGAGVLGLLAALTAAAGEAFLAGVFIAAGEAFLAGVFNAAWEAGGEGSRGRTSSTIGIGEGSFTDSATEGKKRNMSTIRDK